MATSLLGRSPAVFEDGKVEPAIVAEWRRLMRDYAEAQGRRLDEARMVEAMAWSEPTRDVLLTRERALELLKQGRALHCTWSGKALTPRNLDIDHCFPWSALRGGESQALAAEARSARAGVGNLRFATSSGRSRRVLQ